MTPRPSRVGAALHETAEHHARVVVVSGSVGAGHDGAARELAVRLRRTGLQVDVRDLLDVLPTPVPGVLRDGCRLTVDGVPVACESLFRALEIGGPVRGVMLGVCRLGEPASSAGSTSASRTRWCRRTRSPARCWVHFGTGGWPRCRC